MDFDLRPERRMLQAPVRSLMEDRSLQVAVMEHRLDLGLVDGIVMQAGHTLGYCHRNGPSGEISPFVASASALSAIHAGAVV
jgi:hypothetical protein